MLPNRAGSVLTETEEPAVLDDFFGTETEMEPIFAKFQNRERIGTEISEPRVTEVGFLHNFFVKMIKIRHKMRYFDEFHMIFHCS